MTVRRLAIPSAVALAMALTPALAAAATLDEAIALALKHDPGLRRAAAELDAAHARLTEARAGRLPTVTLQASISEAPTAYGHFFGFPDQTLTPRTAGIEVREHLFNGGATDAAVGRAKAGEASASDEFAATQLGLAADVADAFEGVGVADQSLALQHRQADELALVVQQATRKFQDGEVPKTDVDEAQARLAGAQADVARAEGALAVAKARYEELVGEEPIGLEPPASLPDTPADINDAVAEAEAHNPGLAASQAAVSAADEAVSEAKAQRAPTLDLVAGASSIHDEFLPAYQADALSIGVEGRWAIYSGGLVAGKIDEAAAGRNAAEASLDQARDQVRETAIEAWHDLATARAVATAADAEATSADAALASVREEVRVGEKPTLDLLDAEREALAARIADLQAQGARVVAVYRLKAVVGR
jgi:outer membrane protein